MTGAAHCLPRQTLDGAVQAGGWEGQHLGNSMADATDVAPVAGALHAPPPDALPPPPGALPPPPGALPPPPGALPLPPGACAEARRAMRHCLENTLLGFASAGPLVPCRRPAGSQAAAPAWQRVVTHQGRARRRAGPPGALRDQGTRRQPAPAATPAQRHPAAAACGGDRARSRGSGGSSGRRRVGPRVAAALGPHLPPAALDAAGVREPHPAAQLGAPAHPRTRRQRDDAAAGARAGRGGAATALAGQAQRHAARAAHRAPGHPQRLRRHTAAAVYLCAAAGRGSSGRRRRRAWAAAVQPPWQLWHTQHGQRGARPLPGPPHQLWRRGQQGGPAAGAPQHGPPAQLQQQRQRRRARAARATAGPPHQLWQRSCTSCLCAGDPRACAGL